MNHKENLEKALTVIGWSLRFAGCDHYRIMNHKKEPTCFLFYSDRIETDCNEAFGKKASQYGSAGLMYFDLKHCTIDVDKNGDAVSIIPEGGEKRNSNFLSFYNHTIKEEN